MLRAHRQAWAWQDEWFGLTMADIREIERQTAEALKKKMAAIEDTDDDDKEDDEAGFGRQSSTTSSIVGDAGPAGLSTSASASSLAIAASAQLRKSSGTNVSTISVEKPVPIQVQISDLSVPTCQDEEAGTINSTETITFSPIEHSLRGHHHQRIKVTNKSAMNSPGSNSSKSFELLASWRMESIVRKDSDSEGSEDEFFDCLGKHLHIRKIIHTFYLFCGVRFFVWGWRHAVYLLI